MKSPTISEGAPCKPSLALTIVGGDRNRRVGVPKGRPKIAQRFIAGPTDDMDRVPQGRKNISSGPSVAFVARLSIAPSGLYRADRLPAMNRWAFSFALWAGRWLNYSAQNSSAFPVTFSGERLRNGVNGQMN